MKIKRWHVVVLALFVLLCGALFYHFYTERISNEALQAVDFQALRAHTAELLENGFRANDQLFSSDYYDVRPDSTCYIWLNGSENDADTPVSVATGYLNIRKSSPDAENKWMLRVDLWQEGRAGAHGCGCQNEMGVRQADESAYCDAVYRIPHSVNGGFA